MSKATDSDDWQQATVTDPATVEQLREAGASEAFIVVLRTDHPSGGRHSVRQEVRKQLVKWENDPDELTHLAGGFFTALWNGEDYQYRADTNNQPILRQAGLI